MCKTPHKHAELIKAWADGAEIQCRIGNGYRGSVFWSEWDDVRHPHWDTRFEYRIKPELKPDVVYVANVGKSHYMYSPTIRASCQDSKPSSCTVGMNVRFSFDGETGELKKVEMIDE